MQSSEVGKVEVNSDCRWFNPAKISYISVKDWIPNIFPSLLPNGKT